MPPRKKSPSRKKTTAASASKPTPIRREITALVMFFMSIFMFLTLFGMKALALDWLKNGTVWLVGGGFYVIPFALLAAALELAFHRRKPVILRVTATMFIPVTIGALAALSESADRGIIDGFFAWILSSAFSSIGAGIVLVIVLFVLLFVALRLSPTAILRSIIDWRQSRPAYEPLPEQERQPKLPKPEPARLAKESRGERRRSAVDIPLDDEIPAKSAPLEHEEGELFRPKPKGVKTPAQALEDKEEPLEIPQVFMFDRKPKPEVTAPAPVPDIEPIPEPLPEPVPEIVVEKIAPPAQKPPPDDGWDIDIGDTDSLPYRYPPLSLLSSARPGTVTDTSDELKQTSDVLMDTLKSFGLESSIINKTRGPAVTRYDLELEKGIKLSKLVGLSEDIALSLGSSGVRIAPVPDEPSIVGIEVPNKKISAVHLRDVVDSKEFSTETSRIAFGVGRDISGQNIIGNIAKLTHLLIAGTTGSGKSVCINSLIVSLLYKASPDDVRLIMVDPKMVELDVYNGIPHLLVPVVTDPKKAASALQWAVIEMERRYKRFMEQGVRDIFGFNEACKNTTDLQRMPQIVIVIDELADLMLVAAKEVEESIVRIAQKARAAGMHLVVATQRPSADVITGLMKANIPSRIAFAVSSALESRIILDGPGADKLVGYGDMIYQPMGAKAQRRVQGSFISTAEVEAVVGFIKQGVAAEYSDEIMTHMEHAADDKKTAADPQEHSGDDFDELLPAAVEIVLDLGQASTSMLQRRLSLGYARAARIVDQMEQKGIVGPYEGSKPRAVLITKQEWQEQSVK